MQSELIHSMHDQVRAIYRAITGEDVRDDVAEDEASPATTEDSDEEVTRRFAELEAIARGLPSVMDRVPPFSFTPPVDVIATEAAVVVEVALPGIDRDAVTIDRQDDALVISGFCRDGHAARGELFHAEIPRGAFIRVIPLPFPVEGEPGVELDRGLLRIHLTLATASGPDGARKSS